MIKIKNAPVVTAEGTAVRIPTLKNSEIVWRDDAETKPQMHDAADLRELLLSFLKFAIPRQGMTMQDSISGTALYLQLLSSTGEVIEVGESELDWLRKKIEAVSPNYHGVLAAQRIRDAIGADAVVKAEAAGK